MSEDDIPLPKWATAAAADVKALRQYVVSIRAEGQADVERGLQTIELADGLLQELGYLDRTLGQRLPPQVWSDELVSASGIQLAGTAQYSIQAARELASLYVNYGQQRQQQHQQLVAGLYSTATTSGSMTFMGAQIEHRIEAIAPAYQPVLQAYAPQLLSNRSQVFEKLAQQLSGLEPQYLSMLQGSEASLHGNQPDSLGQAAHSMRDLFDKLIKDIAPTNTVKAQPWFADKDLTEQGVSTAARLRYLLYGSGQGLGDAEIKQLDAAAESAKTALRLVIARCHDHDPELGKAEVQTAVDQARFWLSEVLGRYFLRRR